MTTYKEIKYDNAGCFVECANRDGDGKIISTEYATKSELTSRLATKQDTLVSGATIKTINGTPIMGSGDMPITGTASRMTITATGETDVAGDIYITLTDIQPGDLITGFVKYDLNATDTFGTQRRGVFAEVPSNVTQDTEYARFNNTSTTLYKNSNVVYMIERGIIWSFSKIDDVLKMRIKVIGKGYKLDEPSQTTSDTITFVTFTGTRTRYA